MESIGHEIERARKKILFSRVLANFAEQSDHKEYRRLSTAA